MAVYKVSQNKLDIGLDVDRAVAPRGVHEQINSNPETVADIAKALILKVSMLRLKNLLRCVADLMQDDGPLAI